MKARLRIDLQDFKSFVVDDKYNVDYFEGAYACDCALKYKRKYGTECKHIRLVREINKLREIIN